MTEAAAPFIGTEAIAAGLSRRQLSRRFEAVYRNVYIERGALLSARSRATAAWLWSGRDSTLAGLSAAAVHGARWIDPSLPAELIRLGDPVDGIVIYRDRLADSELCVVDGMPTTTPARTAYDLGRARRQRLGHHPSEQRSAPVSARRRRRPGRRGFAACRLAP